MFADIMASPSSPSLSASEPSDGETGAAEALACIPPGEAAAQPRKRLRSAPPEDVGDIIDGEDGKRIKDVHNGSVLRSVVLNDDGQLQLANEEPQSLLFSCHPTGAASGIMMDPSGSTQNLEQISLFELDPTKHKIFLSHFGAQKDFVEQLCVDLERQGYFFPFFDQRHHSLLGGKDFAPLIKEATRLCHVAVIVLFEEFLSSKWPMIELVEFHVAQQGTKGGRCKLKMLPLFFKLSVEDVKDEDCWMRIWKQHAKDDKRIDVTKWSAAMKALSKTNGLEFGKIVSKEVAYRKCVVQSILRLSPPDLLYGSSKRMVGYERMCKVVSSQFVKNTTVGAQVLGLYGAIGLGKTTLSKALCDYYYREFLGKVCHVELGEVYKRTWRQELILKKLCGFERNVVDYIGTDVEKGMTQMEVYLKHEPVFLVIDNVMNDDHSLREARDYLMVGFHPKSKIMITSKSKAILEDLLLDLNSYMLMPKLIDEEARVLFLKHVAPMKSIFELTVEEQNILQICIQKCWFYSYEEGGSYHPLALFALADFCIRLNKSKDNGILLWKDHLNEEIVLLKDVWKSSKYLFDILDLQFSTFHWSEKLLFLDIALYGFFWFEAMYQDLEFGVKKCIEWLCRLHEDTPTIVKRKDLKKSSMINWYDCGFDIITVPGLYKEFAEWYATEHNMKGLKNAWGVFQTMETSLRGNFLTSIRCWSDLVRLRISHLTPANSRLLASKAMQQLSNLVVLQLHECTNMTVLNLKGLDNLCHLELVGLTKLVTIMLLGNSTTNKNVGMYDSLQYVLLEGLNSLTDVPDLRPCSCLHTYVVLDCSKLRNFKGVECPQLKELMLWDLVPHQFERLPDFKSLESLVVLDITAKNDVDQLSGVWVQKENGTKDVESDLKGEGPCLKLLKEFHLYMCQWNRLMCKFAFNSTYWKCV